MRRAAPGMVLAVLTIAVACSREDKAVDSTAAPVGAAETPPPPPIVIPTWPVDTPGFAIDRPYGITPVQRAKMPSCGSQTPVVTADSVGPLYAGMPLPRLLTICTKVYLAWLFDDGNYGPAAAVQLGRALVVAKLNGTTDEAIVTRVAVFAGARTPEQIGPGSTLDAVLKAYGAPTWRRDQCAVDALFESTPGLALRIAPPEEGSSALSCVAIRRLAYGADFKHFPRGSRVSWVAAELPAGR